MNRRVLDGIAVALSLATGVAGQDVPTHALIPGKLFGPVNILQLSYSPDGNRLAMLTTVGFQVRDAKSGRVLNTIVNEVPAIPRWGNLPEPWLSELCWSPDGKRIARAN